MLAGPFREAEAGVSTDYTLTGNQAQDVLAVAKAQIGKTKSDFGWTVDWCGYFAGWCGYTAGADFPSSKTYWANGRMLTYWFVKNNKGKFYYFRDGNYDSLVSHHSDLDSAALGRCIKSNRNSFTPQKGDIILFLWNNAGSSVNWSHVGLVDSYSGGTITTVEGNVSDKVVKTTRKLSDTQVVAFIRPNYKDNSKPVLTVQYTIGSTYGDPYISSSEYSADSSGFITKNGSRNLLTLKLGEGRSGVLHNAATFGLRNNDPDWVFVGWREQFTGTLFDEDEYYTAEQLCPDLKNGSKTIRLNADWCHVLPKASGKSGLYRLKSSISDNVNSGLVDQCLTVSEYSNIQLGSLNGSSSQVFQLTELASQPGVYNITSFASGMSMHAAGNIIGCNVIQTTPDGSSAQQWMLNDDGSGRYYNYYLSPKSDYGLLLEVDNDPYLDNPNVQVGFRTYDDDKRWHLEELTGWQKIDGVWYYIGSGGSVATGWKKISNKWYYFNTDGVMQTGWKKINNKWYYLDKTGAMQTGWKKINEKWYYLDSTGVMQTGWLKLGTKWYYLDGTGVMQTGWQKINSKWYYLDSTGAMQTGWLKLGTKWYYLDSTGVMQTGWLKLGTNWYYLKASGVMAANETLTIDGKKYRFNSSGVWIH